MIRNTYFRLMSFLLLSLFSCTKNEITENTITVTVTYQKDFGTESDTARRYIDTGAKVFLYKGLDPVHDLAHHDAPSYTPHGAITLKNGTIREPDTSAIITEAGRVQFYHLPSQRVAVLALSKYFPGQGRLISTKFGSGEMKSKTMNLNFYPLLKKK